MLLSAVLAALSSASLSLSGGHSNRRLWITLLAFYLLVRAMPKPSGHQTCCLFYCDFSERRFSKLNHLGQFWWYMRANISLTSEFKKQVVSFWEHLWVVFKEFLILEQLLHSPEFCTWKPDIDSEIWHPTLCKCCYCKTSLNSMWIIDERLKHMCLPSEEEKKQL